MSDQQAALARYRPFRTAALVVHLVFSVVFSGLIIYSVVSSVLAMTPPRARSGPEVYTAAQCARGARALLDELDQERRGFAEGSAAWADHRFLEFRGDWLTRKRRLESGCGLERPERQGLRDTLDTMEGMVDLYTTASVQFAGSLGPVLDRVRFQLDGLEAPSR
jgi:hypothetical protein